VSEERVSARGAGEDQDHRSNVDRRALEKLRIGNSIAEAICVRQNVNFSPLQDS